MRISNALRMMCVVLIGVALGLIFYKKIKNYYARQIFQKMTMENNSLQVKKFLLKYKKPQRIEVQNFVKDPKNKFTQDIQNIKNMRIFLDENSNYYVELQLFTDENDPTAPLVVQFRFLDIKNKNLIQEKSLNLF